MDRRVVRLMLVVGVAIVGLWLVGSSMVRVASAQPAPVNRPLALLAITPTVQLVGSDGTTLLSSPAVQQVAPTDSFTTTLFLRSTFTAPALITIDAIRVSAGSGSAGSIGLAAALLTSTVKAAESVPVQLALTSGQLTSGAYTVTIEWSADFATTELSRTSGTASLVLIVDALPRALDWGQTDFSYEADPARPVTATVRLVTWLTDTDDITLQIFSLIGTGSLSASLDTLPFISIGAPQRQATAVVFTLVFEPDRLPLPGTYHGLFRASAPGVEALTSTFSLIVPAQPRGPYRLVVGELGGRTELTSTHPQSLTTALQFTGIRWLPVSADILPWWPALVSFLLLGVGVAVLLGYWLWAQGMPRPFNLGLFFGLIVVACAFLASARQFTAAVFVA